MSTTVNLTFSQKSAFRHVVFRVRDQRNLPVDMSEYLGVSAFKTSYTANVAFTLPIECTADGEIIISGSVLETDVKPGRYVYDILLNDGNRIVSGLATVDPAIA